MNNKLAVIGQIQGDNLAALKQWCNEHKSLLKPTVSTYATGRKELWIKRYCDLRRKPTITEGYRDERLERLGERLLPGFHIGLVLLYSPGVRISLHRDHTVFKEIGVGINLGEATFLMAEMPKKGEQLNPISYPLKDGDCLQFNTKILHGIEPVKNERWGIYFWHLKPQYLN